MQDGEEPDQRSADVDEGLHHVGPNDRSHAAFEGVEQREQHDDADGHHVPLEVANAAKQRPERDADDNRNGKDADAFCGGAGGQKQSGCQRAQPAAKAAFDELIGGVEIAAKIVWQQQVADDDASHEIAHHQLQEGEVGIVGQAGHADDGEGAGFGGDDGERDGPPWNIAIGEEVIAQGTLPLAKA